LQESEKKSKWESPSQEAGSGIKALVITPTRELAIQVADHMKKVSRHTHLRIATIIGGLAPQKQRRVLSRQPQILIATPGRLWELLNEVQKLFFSTFE
jgi:ATP-dependent RNA helicase DDX24/MAK5